MEPTFFFPRLVSLATTIMFALLPPPPHTLKAPLTHTLQASSEQGGCSMWSADANKVPHPDPEHSHVMLARQMSERQLYLQVRRVGGGQGEGSCICRWAMLCVSGGGGGGSSCTCWHTRCQRQLDLQGDEVVWVLPSNNIEGELACQGPG